MMSNAFESPGLSGPAFSDLTLGSIGQMGWVPF